MIFCNKIIVVTKFLEIRVFIVLVMLQVTIATLSEDCMQEDEVPHKWTMQDKDQSCYNQG